MAVGLSAAVANEFLNALCNNTATTILPVTAVWIQLHTADPGAAGTTAIAGNATRKQVSFGTVANGAVSNDTDLAWSTSEVDTTEDYTHYSLWTASTGGTFLQSGTVTANPVTAGDEFTIPTGDLDLTPSSLAA